MKPAAVWISSLKCARCISSMQRAACLSHNGIRSWSSRWQRRNAHVDSCRPSMLREPPYNDGAGGGAEGDGTPTVTEVLRSALEPIAAQIDAAFIYGPTAKNFGALEGHRDIEIMIIGRAIDYADVIPHCIAAARLLGRVINPSVYRVDEWTRKLASGNRVMLALMQQPKIFLIGSKGALPHAG